MNKQLEAHKAELELEIEKDGQRIERLNNAVNTETTENNQKAALGESE